MTVTERMFGVETEFAFALFGAGGQRLGQEGAVRQLMELAARRLPHLPSRGGSGRFSGSVCPKQR